MSHSWQRIGSEESRQRRRKRGFFYAPFSSAHYRSSCHQVLLAVGHLIVSAPVVAASTMVSLSSHPAHPSRSPNCPGSSDSGWHGSRHLSSKQRHHGITASIPSWRLARLIISSIHLIPFPSWSVSPVISSAHLVMRLGQASRTICPWASTGREGRSKQANTKTRTGKRDEKPGSRAGRRTETNTTRRQRRWNEGGTRTASKQAMKGRRGHTTQSRTRTTPLIILARPPHRGLSSVHRPQSIPPPPGRGMSE